MSDLVLPLKAEYFDAIKDGTKAEEFRLCNAYRRWLELRQHGRSLPGSLQRLDDTRKDGAFTSAAAWMDTLTWHGGPSSLHGGLKVRDLWGSVSLWRFNAPHRVSTA